MSTYQSTRVKYYRRYNTILTCFPVRILYRFIYQLREACLSQPDLPSICLSDTSSFATLLTIKLN